MPINFGDFMIYVFSLQTKKNRRGEQKGQMMQAS